ncbi:MAG TPA: MarR family winged helix-turn-helix transcriptional regulator [Solirubrobacteraceae bacterium]|nr:MarR family winged helix-turn-helix transcriptional regulator [Solirubrobacteraceae bacterium]
MAEEVALRGTSSVTVARVIARARVSRRLFYELFADVEDCLLATFNWGVEQGRAVLLEACRDERQWLGQMRIGLAALLRFFDRQPLLAQLCIVHAAGGGRRVLERRSAVIGELCTAVEGGSALGDQRVPGPVVAEGVVGAVLAVLYARVLAQDHAFSVGAPGGEQATTLIDLHGELMSMIVLPYLGAQAAREELERPAPDAPESSALQAGPIAVPASEQVGARLTYRTVQVLRAIAELPAGSNREVAERAGIVDQGQISKILTRLEYQGLVVNRGGNGPARGAPNSWWLTDRGEALERDLRERPAINGGSGRARTREREQ